MKDLLEAPEIASSQPAAQVIIPKPPQPKNHRVVTIAVPLVVVVALALWWKLRTTAPPAAPNQATAVVQRGDFIRSLRLTGTVEAVNFLSIAAPKLTGPGLNQLVVTRIAPGGTRVKKGDLLVLFDQQDQIKNALDQEATYVDLVQQIKKKQADQATAEAADQSALNQAANDAQSAAVEVKRNEILSKIDAEKNLLALEQAQATYAQLKKTFDLKRKSAAAELKSLEIQRDRAREAMDFARNNTQKLEIHAPIDGIVVLNSIWKGGQMGEVQEGDQIRAGQPFMQIVNSSAMQARARVNQADISLLQVGQKVHVGLDAYPDLSFTGQVERIAAIGTTSGLSEKVRTFAVLFSIDGSDPRLMPDLSASLDVQIDSKPGVLTVPRDAVLESGSDDYVMAWDGREYSRESVKVDDENDTQAVIAAASLAEGTRVLRNVNP
ncbi:MAG TPA: efflux RND transporter periplasmic adaptor subunit [Terriglobales bacterium]|nr:efflux RND transporter periplasmic adaptor subunit [Terriglobales bacterium]